MLEDLRADAQILGVIRGDDPEPQDVGAALLHDVLRRDDVAERFRHLAPVLVEHEAMRQHRLVGRAAARAAGFEQRGMKPAAMLVRAFEIERGRPFQLRPLSRARKAWVEPESNHTSMMSVTFSHSAGSYALPRNRAGIGGEPDVRALALDRGGDALDDGRVAQRLAGLAVDEDRDRHAPGALARDAPIRPALDHRRDAVAALRRDPAGLVDRLERLVAQPVRRHRDEPLRRVAEDQRRLRPPGMRIGMHRACRAPTRPPAASTAAITASLASPGLPSGR